VAETSWDAQGEARRALRAITSDPLYGSAALSRPQVMSNLLKDLLPDAPREASILLAAAQADLAGALQQHVAQGMDLGTASRLTSRSFAESTPVTPEACDWVVSELAIALDLAPAAAAGNGTPDAWPQPAGQTVADTPDWPQVSAGQGDQGGYQGQSGFPGQAGGFPGQGAVPGQGSFPGQGAVPGQGSFPGQGAVPGQGSFPGQGAQPGQGSFPGQGAVPGQGSFPGQGAVPGQGSFPGQGAQPGQSSFPGQGGSFPGQGGYQTPGAELSGWSGGSGFGPPQPAKNNNLAIAALVCGVAQFVLWFLILIPGLISAILALVFGMVSMRQIKRRGEAGRGMAVAGVILGALGVAGGIVLGILIAIGSAYSRGQFGN